MGFLGIGLGIQSAVYSSGGASAVAAQYWRVRITENVSGGATAATSAANIEMRATAGGADQVGSGTAIADSSFSASYLPARAFNNNDADFWVSENANYGTHWIGYNFGTPVVVTEILFQRRMTYLTEAPTAGFIQYSDDGVGWSDLWAFSTTWDEGTTERTFTKP